MPCGGILANVPLDFLMGIVVAFWICDYLVENGVDILMLGCNKAGWDSITQPTHSNHTHTEHHTHDGDCVLRALPIQAWCLIITDHCCDFPKHFLFLFLKKIVHEEILRMNL